MARGGKRRPANPAPVSGPGALSQRTDGGPGQPVRVASGGEYGERKASEELQSAAPMASAPVASPGAAPMAPPPAMPNVFGPSEFPTEPGMAGMAAAPPIIPQDPDMLIRYLYNLYPHPALARLVEPGG